MTLLAECRAGDERAWQRLYEERAAQIYRWAVLLGLGPGSAEDAAQEVLVIATRRIKTCHSEQALPTWLYQITRRVVANKRRLAWWRKIVLVEEPALEPAFERSSSGGLEQEVQVRTCLNRMKHKQVELLLLAYVEGFTKEELADTLGIPPGTVASRLRLAKQRFAAIWVDVAGAACAPSRVMEQE
jgi:RNA polymerase sigma-70 factor, ECF subfamily